MIRLCTSALLAAILTAATARAQVYVNDTANLVEHEIGIPTGVPFRMRVIPVQGSTPHSLQNRSIEFTVRHIDTEALVLSTNAEIYSENPAEFIVTWTPLSEGRYRATSRIIKTDDGTGIATSSRDYLTVTNPPSAVGASVTIGASTTLVQVAVSVTSGPTTVDASINSNAFAGANFAINQTIIYSNQVQQIFTNQWLPQTTNNGVIYQYVNTNATGGAGFTNIAGANGITITTNGANITASLPSLLPAADQYLRSNGSNVYWSSDSLPILLPGTNYQLFSYIAATTQPFVIPTGISTIELGAWGGAGAGATIVGGGGGFRNGFFPVNRTSGWTLISGQTIQVVVAKGGQNVQGQSYYGGGTNNTATYIGGGGLGGWCTEWSITDIDKWLVIAGGGGAAVSLGVGGPGGGVSGGDGTGNSFPGRGGTQTAGGLDSAGNPTNGYSNGGFLRGGHSLGNLSPAGGAGLYGGGSATSAVNHRVAGGGSDYCSTNAIYSESARGNLQYPPKMDHPYYISGRALGTTTTGGDGLNYARW